MTSKSSNTKDNEQNKFTDNGFGDVAVNVVSDSVSLNVITDSSGNTTYIGYSLPGTLVSDPGWRITRVVTQGNDATTTHANSEATFDKIWDNRLGYTYG